MRIVPLLVIVASILGLLGSAWLSSPRVPEGRRAAHVTLALFSLAVFVTGLLLHLLWPGGTIHIG